MLTITLRINNKDMDIMVRPDQRLSEVLKILKENQKLFFQTEKLLLYSVRKKEYVNQKLTFAQGEIYHGDVLTLR